MRVAQKEGASLPSRWCSNPFRDGSVTSTAYGRSTASPPVVKSSPHNRQRKPQVPRRASPRGRGRRTDENQSRSARRIGSSAPSAVRICHLDAQMNLPSGAGVRAYRDVYLIYLFSRPSGAPKKVQRTCRSWYNCYKDTVWLSPSCLIALRQRQNCSSARTGPSSCSNN
jgi:hypothetical protein